MRPHRRLHRRHYPTSDLLDWSQYGAVGWAEACPRVDLSNLIGGWSGS